ncbi:type I-E CRISPR-associated protein Cas6/Cse3/CasE [Aquibium sp. A9E412]|uniref:type I-E CRISPR-associated protein Cas6/Cse3/CasE n=1 Tax=Aquibium sp. A9E412 TaxID=2976767 RepID=UPI0025B01E3E|nr:type I-E CRISPR-associated protein Cas6/Cse3/CasE [Aquibium sp. A9E412]MDN2565197.1 type I-E CRISPR-associated protein Cas6/Cse3/CasE [Aquibium sp. A9E412]
MTLYFSRLTLKRDPSTEALRQLIDPSQRARATDAHHRLLWSVFSDAADRTRDFLWRSEPRGRFYVLSERPPEPHGLFEPPEVKTFAPALSAGDRLAFLLRANAVTQKPKDPNDRTPNGEPRRRKVDVAMHALRHLPGREASQRSGSAHEVSPRQAARFAIARAEAHKWLDAQGVANGFRPDPLPADEAQGAPAAGFELEHYFTVALPGDRRGRRKGEPRFGVFDMKGILTVTDPAAFLAKLAAGFGRAKAYGCGLMLIRRA